MRIVFDIDGVLADVRPYVQKHLLEENDWDTYFTHTLDFPVIKPLAILLRILERTDLIYFLTARPESNRSLTTQWIEENLYLTLPYTLIMNPNGSKEPNYLMKARVIGELKPDIVIDDDPQVAELVSGMGFIVLQVHGFRITNKDMVPWGQGDV